MDAERDLNFERFANADTDKFVITGLWVSQLRNLCKHICDLANRNHYINEPLVQDHLCIVCSPIYAFIPSTTKPRFTEELTRHCAENHPSLSCSSVWLWQQLWVCVITNTLTYNLVFNVVTTLLQLLHYYCYCSPASHHVGRKQDICSKGVLRHWGAEGSKIEMQCKPKMTCRCQRSQGIVAEIVADHCCLVDL